MPAKLDPTKVNEENTELRIKVMNLEAACTQYRHDLKEVVRNNLELAKEIAQRALNYQEGPMYGKAMHLVVKAAVMLHANRRRVGGVLDAAWENLKEAIDHLDRNGATMQKWFVEEPR